MGRSNCLLLIALGAVWALGANASPHAAPSGAAFLSREVVLDHRWLNVPVKLGAPRRTVSLIVAGEVVRAFEVELAEGAPDFWAGTDVSAWKGAHAVLQLDPVGHLGKPEVQADSLARPPGAAALSGLRLDDERVDAAALYHEPDRPQFHFSAPRGWLNDPNGLLYDRGEYHLFYQFQPFSMTSLNSDKSWGHAVSRDLLHWTELPVALRPDRHGGIWSGSALVDTRNIAGCQTGSEPALLIFYTATGRSAMNPKEAEPADFTQRMVFSNDRGRTWTQYGGNPILKNITPFNRDPLVFWHAPSHRWVMVLYVGYPISNPGNHPTAQIFNSTDLRHWTYQSRMEGYFDGPMFFSLPLDGDPANPRWIIHCADMKYRVGRFDGKVFTSETDPIPSHLGKAGETAYAAEIFRNWPDDRTVQLAWLYDSRPGARQIMTFPSELALTTTPAGPRLRWQPAREIEHLYAGVGRWRDRALAPGTAPFVCGRGRYFDLQAVIDPGAAEEVELNLRGLPLVLHARSRQLTVRGYTLPVALKDGRLHLRVLLDATSLELFADDGLVYLPLAIPGFGPSETLTLETRGGAARVESLQVAAINSIWPSAGAVSRPD